ncbi:insulinase family protein [Marinobacterium jannaschii]|uniref:insulinase family protein n=1 Tax=Marinobacterium jannaschii TaxID=64970 RepID=UPI00048248E1|nr:insulinase family protein [Marinobacterium jannaschii]
MAVKTVFRTLWHAFGVVLLAFIGKAAHAGIHKSPNDHREYLTFKLPNNMSVLVISDPDSDKAAAAMNVAVGSSADPQSRPGLAHFLEHMLFLGTRKYPQADGYHKFIKSHGGRHNAYTSPDNTNYYFDISADSLEPALDRFAQFFVAPLLDEKYVERERHAVHSEYRARMRDDRQRLYSATKQVMNADHGYSHFSVGSMKTLAGDVRPDLVAFYDHYYSANMMSLVVEGKESVEELKAMVEAKFAEVPDKDVKPASFNDSVFADNTLPARLSVKCLKNEEALSLTFPLDSVRQYWQEKPLRYISSLIGYEGHGSLLAYLKQQGWANNLMASQGLDLKNEATFKVDIDLTDEGYANKEKVIESFFSFIAKLKDEGVRADIYQEEQELAQTHFRFREAMPAMKEVSHLAKSMQYYPAEHVIDGPYLMSQFNADHIHAFLKDIRPDNMLLTVQAQDVVTDQKDPWFNTEYKVEPLTDRELAHWSTPESLAELSVRGQNRYIADHFDLKTPENDDQQTPEVIFDRDGLTLWHLQDQEFNSPQADAYFSVTSPQANDSARNAVMTALYTRMVQDRLGESLYDARLAGFNTRIYPHVRGFTVRLSGYSDKMPLLLQQVTDGLTDTQLDKSRFARMKQQLAADLGNARKDKPYNQTIGEIFRLLLPQWSNEEKALALASVEFSDLERFIPVLLSDNKVRMMTHGNLLEDEALALSSIVEQAIVTRQKTTPDVKAQVVKLEENTELTQTLDISHNDSAISVYFQGEDTEVKSRAEFALLSEIVTSPFYTQLRTEKQLGYIVFQTPLTLGNAPGLAFVVQSPKAEPGALEGHINGFLDQMTEQLATLDEAQLEQFKRSVVSKLMRRDKNLHARSNRLWKQIDETDSDFDTQQQLAAAVQALSLADLQKCYRGMAARKLVVRSFGDKHRSNGLYQREANRRCDKAIRKMKQQGEYFEV